MKPEALAAWAEIGFAYDGVEDWVFGEIIPGREGMSEHA